MPAEGRLCVVREFAGQVHENRSGQVAFQVLAVPIRPAQDPTHVQEHGALPRREPPVHFGRVHQNGHLLSFS